MEPLDMMAEQTTLRIYNSRNLMEPLDIYSLEYQHLSTIVEI